MSGNKKILLTGATGFIGSHIARRLVKSGFTVIATKREQSDLWRCKDFSNKIIWLNTNKENWQRTILRQNPEILIHAAWEGINTKDRDNWDLQKSNFEFSTNIFNTALYAGAKKIIALGSQAEYGIFSERITEQYLPRPADAYGATKLHTCNYWYWLRVFSVFGPGENDSWLIPQVIKSLGDKRPIDLTEGKQFYDYMYINDFTENLMKIIDCKDNTTSDIYNFGSGSSIQLKELLIKLASILNVSGDLLKFGAIPYHSVQSMCMECNCAKFVSVFGKLYSTKLEQALKETVDYYNICK